VLVVLNFFKGYFVYENFEELCSEESPYKTASNGLLRRQRQS
jgi:hypothetical protein